MLYVQTSTEFAANNLQTYLNATEALERALEDSSWSAALEQKENFRDKPPAIIIDIDETVLDNSPFQSRTILSGLSYPNGWSKWVNESKAIAVEGVYDFLHYANDKEVEIYYLTNRLESFRDPTIKNLINIGLPFKNENMLLMRIVLCLSFGIGIIANFLTPPPVNLSFVIWNFLILLINLKHVSIICYNKRHITFDESKFIIFIINTISSRTC